MNCIVIIDERTSLPYCIIRSNKPLSDEMLKEYANNWMNEHNNNCSWSNYRYIIMNVNDAPKLKNVHIIQFIDNMNKLKAICRIICSKHFYLITAGKKLNTEQLKSKNTDDYILSGMIQLYWELYWKSIAHKY